MNNLTPEAINLAREWLATVQSVPPRDLPPEMQNIIDTIDEALELAMELVLKTDNLSY